ncbi:MAG TPA: hypothetical protein PJ986_12635 [Gammaproteobacteria bacterium]|nr:hypothetical protein [Gammaproteobacteria bacterium]
MSETPPTDAPTPTRCAGCGKTFGCGARLDACWCQQLPPLDPARIAGDAGCYCPDCLAALIAEQRQTH